MKRKQNNVIQVISQEKSDERIFSFNLITVTTCFIIALTGFGYILATLPEKAAVPSDQLSVCISGGWKVALIITHVIPLALIPLAMRIFYESLTILGSPRRAIFASQLGLSFIMVAIASEIGWHVTQCWYYQNEFTMLNFMFYFFLLSGFSLWADGLVEKTTKLTNLTNILFATGLLMVSILYFLGYRADNPSYKTPIYITLTLVFTVRSCPTKVWDR